jgi:protein-disulfide isomerase
MGCQGGEEPERLARWRSILDIIAAVSMTLAAIVMILWVARSYVRRPHVVQVEPAPPTEPVALEGAELRGDRGAGVAIIEYSDFQCPSCGHFARESLPVIDRLYVQPGKVLLAFRHFPISDLHPFAFAAAEAATCAGRQGQFWNMHDLLFRNQDHLGRDDLQRAAASLDIS